jgi:hypothetical protein
MICENSNCFCRSISGGSFRSDIVKIILKKNPTKFDPTKIKNPSKYIQNKYTSSLQNDITNLENQIKNIRYNTKEKKLLKEKLINVYNLYTSHFVNKIK